jgi:CheY-like chemotaxis protein
MSKEKLVYMLLADPDDKLLTFNTLHELGYNVPTRIFSSSEELFTAIDGKRPSVILIDYNLTPEPGLEILKKVRLNTLYNSIPVVILMDSPRWQDYEQCYMNGASTVIKKPGTTEMTFKKIKIFFDYWINVAETQ